MTTSFAGGENLFRYGTGERQEIFIIIERSSQAALLR
jgi:hypothetical protein